ncbi:MAG: hypothetical protein U0L92_04265, partial [Clostridia bacterium]|nr:hypothetical protein [Clostridia bacterium]
FVTRYDIDAHIAKLCQVYGEKCQLMIDCVDKYFPSCVTHTNPEGGLFLFCTMPEQYDAKAVMQKVLEKGVAFVPGATTMIDDKKTYSTFRMNYSTASKEDIEKGVKILGEVLKEVVGE